jgi:hypothetical protein
LAILAINLVESGQIGSMTENSDVHSSLENKTNLAFLKMPTAEFARSPRAMQIQLGQSVSWRCIRVRNAALDGASNAKACSTISAEEPD